MRVIIQPSFCQPGDTTATTPGFMTVYDAATHTPIKTIQLQVQPNSLCTYTEAAANIRTLFVSTANLVSEIQSYDLGLVVDPAVTQVADPLPPSLSGSGVGMAIQPGTGDLFIAVWGDQHADKGGILRFAKSPPMKPSYHDEDDYLTVAGFDGIPTFSANVAFDSSGGLWLSGSNDPAKTTDNQFLTWIPDPIGRPADVCKLLNGTQIAVTKTPDTGQPGRAAYPLSQPEGLAFDPFGNLWLACNDDDYGVNQDFPDPTHSNNYISNGALLCFTAAWLAALIPLKAMGPGPTTDGFPIGNGPGAVSRGPEVPSQIYVLHGAKFGGLAFDGTTLLANDESHGVVWQATVDSLGNLTGWKDSGISAVNPGNGQMVVVDTDPPQLTIRDNAGDTGAEPDPDAAIWESPDIMLFAPGFGAEPIIYVTIHNTGPIDSTGSEVLKLHWGLASTGLGWPAPWDGAVPGTGGLVGAQIIPVIPSGGTTALQFFGVTPFPPDLPGLHVCLLARIETTPLYPFGMTMPETFGPTGDPGQNTIGNRGIAWHNVTYPNTADPVVLIRMANHTASRHDVALHVQAIDRHRNRIAVPGRLTLKPEPQVARRLGALQDGAFGPDGDNGMAFLDPAKGLRGLALDPNEIMKLPFTFHADPGHTDFALRFVQTVQKDGRKHVVGGQTFVYGTVKGFPRPHRQ